MSLRCNKFFPFWDSVKGGGFIVIDKLLEF